MTIFKPEVSEPPCTKIDSPTDEIVPEFIIVKLSHVAVPSPTLIPWPLVPVEFIIVPWFSKVPPVPVPAVWGKSTTLAWLTVDLIEPLFIRVGFGL